MNNSLSLAKPRAENYLPPNQGVAIVTGSRGQDGSYLRDLVGSARSIGCVNPKSTNRGMLAKNEVAIDLGDKNSVMELLEQTRPAYIYHLAARHGPSGMMSFEEDDIYAMRRIHVESTRNLLECVESLGLDTHLVIAGSSRIFSPTSRRTEIDELSSPNPGDFYGESKLAAWKLVQKHRQDFGLKASFLVLFNHESPRRPDGYFSKDVSRGILAFLNGDSSGVSVRDGEALGDWSDARDVVKLMLSVASSSSGGDYVVASGSLRTVKDVVESSLKLLGNLEAPLLSSHKQPDAQERWCLEANNSKAIREGHWDPVLRIEQTIVEIVRSSLKVT